MKRLLLALFLLLGLDAVALAQNGSQEAALGLRWGMPAAAVRASGVVLAAQAKETLGVSFTATKLPKTIVDAETVSLYFGYDDKLWRIAIQSKAFEHDPSAAAAKARYAQLSKLLSEKYGKGDPHHHAADRYETGHFVLGLMTGTNWWFTNFANAAATIQIGLSAAGPAEARCVILFENKALRAAFDRAKQDREKGAL